MLETPNSAQIKVKDRNTGAVQEVRGVTPSLTDPKDGKKDISFSITATADNAIVYNMLIERNTLIVDEEKFKNQRYIITNVNPKWQKGTWTKEITAMHIFIWRLNYNQVRETLTGTLSLDKAIAHALKGSGFSYNIMNEAKNISGVEQENFGNNNSTSLIDEIVEDYGIEIEPNNTELYIYKTRGEEVNYIADCTKNVEGLTISIDTDGCYTRAKGYGKYDENKKKYLAEVEYVHPDENKFMVEDRPIVGPPIEDEKYTKNSSLLAALKEYVNPYPKVTVELDLNTYKDPKLKGIEQDFKVGDTIKVLVDTDMKYGGMVYEEKVRIIEKSYNPLDQTEKPKLTLSSYRKNITDYQADAMLLMRNNERLIKSTTRNIRDNASKDRTAIQNATYIDFTKYTPTLYVPRLNLAYTTVLQSHNIDRDNKRIYATQVYNGAGTNSGQESFIISRMDMSGKLIDSMICLNGGHGTNIGLDWDRTSGTMYIWSHYYVGASGNKHRVVRFPYQPGKTIDYNDASIQTFDNLTDGTYSVVSIDIEHQLLMLRQVNHVIVMDLTQARKNIKDIITEVDVTTSYTVYQGGYLDYPYLYWYTGDTNEATEPATLAVYDVERDYMVYEKRIIFAKNSVISWENNFREPEGVQVYVDPRTKARTVIIGFTTGAVGARISKLYAYREPAAAEATNTSYSTDLYTTEDATTLLKSTVQSIILEYNGTSWGVSTAARAVVTQQNLVSSVAASGNDLIVTLKDEYFSLIGYSKVDNLTMTKSGVSSSHEWSMGGVGSNKITIGLFKSGTQIAPNNNTSIPPGSRISIRLEIGNPADS